MEQKVETRDGAVLAHAIPIAPVYLHKGNQIFHQIYVTPGMFLS